MSFKKQDPSRHILYETGLENIFILEYMSKAPGDFVKAYVLAQMYAQLGQPLSNEDIARALGISAAQVQECWDYWEKEGLISRSYPDPENRWDYDVEFIVLREQVFGRGTVSASSPRSAKLDSKELSGLYSKIEEITGRLLEGNEPVAIAGWVESYGMEPEMILAGYKYCVDQGKTTRYNYVGSILKDWKAKGLASAQDVEEHLADMDKHYDLYKKVFRALGFKRSPGEEEMRRMRAWTDEMGFPIERILEACAKSSGISNPNINYVDSVLKAWYKEEHGESPSAGKDLYSRVMALYEEDRKRNNAKTAEIRREIYEKIPRVKDLNQELQDARFKLSRALFMGPNGAVTQEREKKHIDQLIEERTRLLKDAGFAPDAGEQIYSCRLCKDTGELDDGSRCSCFKEKLALLQAE
ncbi:MAG: DnaD domain protein [Firmicutes bacterium]|nr:DnaD domain protein [Bacillota bacterium]